MACTFPSCPRRGVYLSRYPLPGPWKLAVARPWATYCAFLLILVNFFVLLLFDAFLDRIFSNFEFKSFFEDDPEQIRIFYIRPSSGGVLQFWWWHDSTSRVALEAPSHNGACASITHNMPLMQRDRNQTKQLEPI